MLADRLKKLGTSGVLLPTLADWAKEVRLVGNAGAHVDPINTVSKKDAEELIAFDVIRKPLVRRDIAEPLAQALHESAGKQSRVETHPSRDASPLRGE